VLNLLKEVAIQKKNGAFGTTCPLHDLIGDSTYVNEQFTIPLNSNFTVCRAIEQWMKHPTMDNIHLEVDRWAKGNQGCI
jgi:hypothetical protein